MALQSSRKGLRKEAVDYLGNIIIDTKLKQDIVNSIDDVFADKADVLTYEEIQASSDLTGKIASASALKKISTVTQTAVSANLYAERVGNIVHLYSKYGWSEINENTVIPFGFRPLNEQYFDCYVLGSGIDFNHINSNGAFQKVFSQVIINIAYLTGDSI